MRCNAFLAAAVAAASLSLQTAEAHSVKVGTLDITGLWTRATPPNAPTAGGYMTVTNTGDEPDRLLSAASPEARLGEIHEMKMSDGVMTMRPVEGGIEIPAEGAVTLAPGGFHLMFIDLEKPLIEGSEMPVTLIFAKAGKIDTFMDVLSIGAKGPVGATAGGAYEGHTE